MYVCVYVYGQIQGRRNLCLLLKNDNYLIFIKNIFYDFLSLKHYFINFIIIIVKNNNKYNFPPSMYMRRKVSE